MDILERDVFHSCFFGHCNSLVEAELAKGVSRNSHFESVKWIAAVISGSGEDCRARREGTQAGGSADRALEETAAIQKSGGFNCFHLLSLIRSRKSAKGRRLAET